MPTKKRVVTKRTLDSCNIDIEVWDEDTLKRFPITKQHIGTSVRYANSPRSKDYTLLEIKEPGDQYFAEGGYILEEKGVPYKLHIFLDEIIPWTKPKKVKTANSQLARKKKKTVKKRAKKKKS